MINHEHKFIFIHVPRTGGSSIEDQFNYREGREKNKHWTLYDWQNHLDKEVFNEYFKFTFVRNPWDRMVSLLKYGRFYGVYLGDNNIINTENYFTSFKKVEKTDPKDKVLITILNYVLTQWHYHPHEINDTFSENVYTKFIDRLDPSKIPFYQSIFIN